MRLAVIASSYPSATDPVAGRFVQQFVSALAREDVDITVIAPVAYARRRFGPLPPRETDDGHGISRIRVLHPRFMSFSSKDLLITNTMRLTQRQFNDAVLRAVRSLARTPDLFYGHFLYTAGYAAVVAADTFHRPSVAAVGEGTFWSVDPIGFNTARRHFERITGVLAVSSVIARALTEELGIPADKIRVFPNGVDLGKFHARNRTSACEKFAVPTDTFNIVFVGSTSEGKGVRRLLRAVEGLSSIRLVLVGQGTERLSSPSIAFQGVLDHVEVAEIMGTGDAFVLPTTAEGSSNVLIEAMACGLPIITSDGEYNDDTVDSSVAIRIDPRDVSAIKAAIAALMDHPDRRRAMADACLVKAKQFDIQLRAKRVKAWLGQVARGHDRSVMCARRIDGEEGQPRDEARNKDAAGCPSSGDRTA